MYIVKAARWHGVELLPFPDGTSARCCSACACSDLSAAGEIALDAATGVRYRVVRCHGCAYDLLEPLASSSAAAS
jgi:hypothetical protein